MTTRRTSCHTFLSLLGPVAQLVEQRIENPRVGGSIPPRGTISSLVQSVERWTVNPYVAGSSPAGGAKFSFGLEFVCLLLQILN